jgi:hypothetical protein
MGRALRVARRASVRPDRDPRRHKSSGLCDLRARRARPVGVGIEDEETGDALRVGDRPGGTDRVHPSRPVPPSRHASGDRFGALQGGSGSFNVRVERAANLPDAGKQDEPWFEVRFKTHPRRPSRPRQSGRPDPRSARSRVISRPRRKDATRREPPSIREARDPRRRDPSRRPDPSRSGRPEPRRRRLWPQSARRCSPQAR